MSIASRSSESGTARSPETPGCLGPLWQVSGPVAPSPSHIQTCQGKENMRGYLISSSATLVTDIT